MASEVKQIDPRAEFNKYRRKLLKANNIEHLICARCGEWRHSVHLHHIKELVYGGTNEASNLIPLCFECHDEWDKWDDGKIEFGTFLLTPKLRDFRKVFFGKLAVSSYSMEMYRSMMIPCRSSDWDAMYEKKDEVIYDYETELARQNALFSHYPYSDKVAMFRRYGSIPDPMLLEDISMLSQGKTLEECISKRGEKFKIEGN